MEKLYVIRTPDQIRELQKYLEGQTLVAVDTETTGLDKDARVIGYSVCAEIDVAYYVITKYWDKANKKLVELDNFSASKELIKSLEGKDLLMHNAVYDCELVDREFGIQLLPHVHTDTMLAAHLCNENQHIGLKEQGAIRFGVSAKKEQEEMKASIVANGGLCTKKNYELYKADPELIGRYGAKDTLLTYALFFELADQLIAEGLDKFFWEEETMPLLRTATYQLNTTGLKVDATRLEKLGKEIELNCLNLTTDINAAVTPLVQPEYDGKSKKGTFNFNSNQQLAWLLFIKMGFEFRRLTKKGREVAKELLGKIPYTAAAKREFIAEMQALGQKPYKFMQVDKKTLILFSLKHKWVARLMELKKEQKILKTYVNGIQSKLRYNVIYPSFKQAGTVTGRYSSNNPNFQNLPRDDKRIKECIIARPGRILVGADYSQLEPRVFTALSQDPILLDSYANELDFYSTVGIPVFGKYECSANKKDPNYFGKMFPLLRQVSKEIALSNAYGITAHKHADNDKIRHADGSFYSVEECQELIDTYFERYVGIANMVRKAHRNVLNHDVVYSLYGRPRRIPEAESIRYTFGIKETIPDDQIVDISDMTYQQRTILNSGVNSPIQGTAASIVNRAAIAYVRQCALENLDAPIVMQVHDEIIVEPLEHQAARVFEILKDCMENTCKLPGVALVAEPKMAHRLSDLK